MPRKLISFDWAIKRILRSKANFDILEGFLSELLFEDITILEILESESNQEYRSDKFNRLDIKVKNQNKEIILIEIQYDREMDYMQRILYASSKAIVEHLKESQSYSKITKIISISILYFDFGDGDDYIYKGTTNFIGLHNKSILKLNENQKKLYKTSKVEKIFPEYYLIKIKNFNDNSKDSLDEWINFLKNETIPDNPKAKGLLKAKETLDYLKMDDSERVEYEAYQKSIHDQASAYESTFIMGHIKGVEKGIELERKNSEARLREEKINMAKKLSQKGFNIESISDITNLSIDDIKSILI